VSVIADAVGALAADIAGFSSKLGRRVAVDEHKVADRSQVLALKPPGLWSPNRSCRLVRALDGWIAVNLPRESDRWLVPAWIGCGLEADPWRAIISAARTAPWRELVAGARLLGLPAAGVAEIAAERAEAPLRRMEAGRDGGRSAPPSVIDMSSMWAGPLCGAILAAAGFRVAKLESRSRPDAARASPDFFRRLNGDKTEASVDLADPQDLARLAAAIAAADVVITSARPRAFEQLGLSPEAMFARNPGLVWVAVTGYGYFGEGSDRVAFGDDAAAAGGLVRRTAAGEPRFAGDALADPLTGLAAAAGALKAVVRGGGFLVDAALARTAAGVAGAHAVAAA
jgi:hypothetical protein